MIYILTFAQSFVLGRKSPFSFELNLSRGGEKNEEMLIISSGGRRGDHLPNLIGSHSLDGRLDGLSINRSPSQLRFRLDSISVVLAELFGSCFDLRVVCPVALEREQQVE